MSSFYADMPEHGVGVDFGVRHSWVLVVWSLSFCFGSYESPGAILAIVACEEFFAFGCFYGTISWVMAMLNDFGLFGELNHSSRLEKRKQEYVEIWVGLWGSIGTWFSVSIWFGCDSGYIPSCYDVTLLLIATQPGFARVLPWPFTRGRLMAPRVHFIYFKNIYTYIISSAVHLIATPSVLHVNSVSRYIFSNALVWKQ